MTCGELRDRLLAGEATAGAAGRHLAGCAECARFARRLELARQTLGAEAGFTPDAGFPARVLSRLPRGPELVGLAALRLLPATLALALALGAWCLLVTPSPGSLVVDAPTDDPLTWVADLAPEAE